MESTHTPGPWFVDHAWKNIYHRNDANLDDPHSGVVIARCDGPTDLSDAEVTGNMHLLSAAPELLEALEAAARYIPSYRDGDSDMMSTQEKINARTTREKAVAALAKARGNV